MIGCKSYECWQGRKACPHPAKCWTRNGGGGSVDTPATSERWMLYVYTGLVFMAGMSAGVLSIAVAMF